MATDHQVFCQGLHKEDPFRPCVHYPTTEAVDQLCTIHSVLCVFAKDKIDMRILLQDTSYLVTGVISYCFRRQLWTGVISSVIGVSLDDIALATRTIK